MEVISEKKRIKTVAKRWAKQYGEDNQIYKQLIDLEPKTTEQVTGIIGNSSWTRIKCDECEDYKRKAVIFTSYDDDIVVCTDCCRKAVQKLKNI